MKTARDRTALYRHFDVNDKLLYVGISLSPIGRLNQHAVDSHWSDSIARVTVEWLPTRKAALDAEMVAIRAERPAHNIAGVIRPISKRSINRPTAFAVLQAETHMADGWYFETIADEVLAFYQAEYPEMHHVVVRSNADRALVDECRKSILEGNRLRPRMPSMPERRA